MYTKEEADQANVTVTVLAHTNSVKRIEALEQKLDALLNFDTIVSLLDDYNRQLKSCTATIQRDTLELRRLGKELEEQKEENARLVANRDPLPGADKDLVDTIIRKNIELAQAKGSLEATTAAFSRSKLEANEQIALLNRTISADVATITSLRASLEKLKVVAHESGQANLRWGEATKEVARLAAEKEASLRVIREKDARDIELCDRVRQQQDQLTKLRAENDRLLRKIAHTRATLDG